VRFGGVDEDAFLGAYLRELDHAAALTGPRNVDSIFFGGGTPSLMAPATVAALIDHVARLWTVDQGAEITLEANPGSVEAGRFRGYAAAGVNRVSLGVQSLYDDVLKSLGRIHTADEARTALDIARTTFDRCSFDLIYARPRQLPEAWRAELREALRLARGHLSLYQLTIEPETPFAALHAKGKLIVPDADAALALYEVTQEETEAAGLPAYEISNHAAAGEQSRHNLVYWRYGDYVGCGPGAHGRLAIDGARFATSAERGPEAWAERVRRDGHGWIERTPLGAVEQRDERLLMGLRLSEGVSLARIAPNGVPAKLAQAIADLSEPGLVETFEDGSADTRVRATALGRFVLNEIVLRLSVSLEDDAGSDSPMDNPPAAD
jgi:putative oxygen-independent coproporphyrinogen III oxidase